MNTAKYLKNKQIESFVLEKEKAGTPYTEADIAYVNGYIGYGGMWKQDSNLPKERGLYEYYTPIVPTEKMVGLAYKYGFTEGKILEPSCGIGRILHYFSPKAPVTGIELDKTSYLIAKANFPTFDLRQQSFNNLFVDRRGNPQSWKPEYKLVIGNPPYGEFKGRGTSAEKQATKSNTYVDYFITRSLDLLLPNGLLIYIIPSAFLNNDETEVKRRILAKADLIDAYRLPVNTFEQTQIQTDIVVFRKK